MTTTIFSLYGALLFSLLFAVGCGNKNSDEKQESITAPTINGSSMKGLVFSAISAQTAFRGASLYYYDFSQGTIKEILTNETDNPIVLNINSQVFFFTRKTGESNLRILDPAKDPMTATPLSIAGIGEGDPWDAVLMPSSTENVVLALREAEKVILLNSKSGSIVDTLSSNWNTDEKPFHPISLASKGSDVFVLHHGLGLQNDANDSQRIFVMSKDSKGNLVSEDQDTSTDEIDGISLKSSNPVGFFHKDQGQYLMVGLCSDWIGAACTAAAETFTPSTRKVSELVDLTDIDYEYKGHMTEGESEYVVYAHVKRADKEEYAVVRMDFTGGKKEFKELLTTTDSGLFGLFFDKSSGTLFVGGKIGGSGSLTLYRDSTKQETVELSRVPYNGAFISN